MYYTLYKGIQFGLIALIMAGMITACSDDDKISSVQVGTHQMFATFQVVADGSDHVYAQAQLTHRDASNKLLYVTLNERDQLWLSAGELLRDVDLNNNLFDQLNDLNQIQAPLLSNRDMLYTFLFISIIRDDSRYATRLPRNTDDTYRISLLRAAHTDASESYVNMPLDFTLYAPIANDTYSRNNDDVQIEWAPVESDTQVTVEIRTSCPNTPLYTHTYALQDEPDTGLLTIPAGTLSDTRLQGNCSTTINLVRSRLGTFDPAFIGGHVAGHQMRSRVITTTN